jgi:hypothetical protein
VMISQWEIFPCMTSELPLQLSPTLS